MNLCQKLNVEYAAEIEILKYVLATFISIHLNTISTSEEWLHLSENPDSPVVGVAVSCRGIVSRGATKECGEEELVREEGRSFPDGDPSDLKSHGSIQVIPQDTIRRAGVIHADVLKRKMVSQVYHLCCCNSCLEKSSIDQPFKVNV